MQRLLIPILLFLLAPLGAIHAAGGDVLVRWNEEDYRSIDLPQELPAAARSAIDAWAEWADKRAYRIDVSRDGRVVLVSHLRNAQFTRQMELIESTITLFDAKLPAPAERAEVGAPLPGEPGYEAEPETPAPDDPLPDDPEEEPNPWGDLADELGGDHIAKAWKDSWNWGAGMAPPDTETIVFFIVKKPAEYKSILRQLAKTAPYLKEWAVEAEESGGFALQEPLAGAYQELGEGREEWSPEGELVNRVASLLLLRRFGQQPYWFTMGWSWIAELEITGAIYCFPYRDEFVWATEHSGWEGILRSKFRGRERPVVSLHEFANWKRGSYDDNYAKLSWGVVHFLLEKRAATLPAFLEELRAFRDKDNRVRLSETDWERDRFYTIPLDALDRLARPHLGDTWLHDASEFFREEL